MADRPVRRLGTTTGTANALPPRRRGLARLRPLTVRARATLGACAVVAIALAIASMALVGLLDANLLHNAEADADAQADAVAQAAVAASWTRCCRPPTAPTSSRWSPRTAGC